MNSGSLTFKDLNLNLFNLRFGIFKTEDNFNYKF